MFRAQLCKCGVNKITALYQPLTNVCRNDVITYDEWLMKKKVLPSKKRKASKEIAHLPLATIQCTVAELVDKACKDVKLLSAHEFRVRSWQHNMYVCAKENSPPASALIVVDFSENYTCSLHCQDEVQSYHWGQEQVTIHPIMAYPLMSVGFPRKQKEYMLLVMAAS